MWLTQEIDRVLKNEYAVKDKTFDKNGIQVYDSAYFGKVFLVNGKPLYCEHDSAMRHEIMAHTAICTHEEPKRVLVVDGGDGALAAELIKHKDIKIDIVEREAAVVEASKELDKNYGALENKAVSLVVEEPLEFIKKCDEDSFDIVFLNRFNEIDFKDSSFFDEIVRITTSKGIAVVDAASQLFDMSGHKSVLSSLDAGFKIVMPFNYTSMVQAGGEKWFAMGSKFFHPTADINLQRADLTDGFVYYNSDVHVARFALPTSTFENLKEYIKR